MTLFYPAWIGFVAELTTEPLLVFLIVLAAVSVIAFTVIALYIGRGLEASVKAAKANDTPELKKQLLLVAVLVSWLLFMFWHEVVTLIRMIF